MNWRYALARLRYRLPRRPKCGGCSALMSPYADWDGEGWSLGWACSRHDCYQLTDFLILWPFGERKLTPRELERLGFEIV